MTSRPMTARGTLCFALVLVAGLAVSAEARQDRTNDQRNQPADIRDRSTDREIAGAGTRDFRSFKWISGLDVFNPSGDHIADVSDLIINRGSGKIDNVVLATGQTLGLGGKTITIPFATLRWDSAKERFVLDATEDELKTYPEFNADHWAGLADPDAGKKNTLRDWLTRDRDRYDTDPYEGSLGNAEQKTITGTITDIDRVQSATGELVVATIRDESGKSYRVWLGPSWYVGGGAHAPMRGDKVTVNAYSVNRDGDDTYVGRSMSLGGSEIAFRNDQGAPVWNPSGRPAEVPSRDGSRPANANWPGSVHGYSSDRDASWRSILASDLTGRDVKARGQDCGEVQDLVVDRATGRVVMLSIDPDENFLGMADTKRLVPWTVTTVAVDGTVRIDATKEMVLASPETPSDIEDLNNTMTANSVYKAFEVDAPRYDGVDEKGWRDRRHRDADDLDRTDRDRDDHDRDNPRK